MTNYANKLMDEKNRMGIRIKGKKCPECGSNKIHFWCKNLLICAECHNKFEPKGEVRMFKQWMDMSKEQKRKHLIKIGRLPKSEDDRSLQGWADIIMGKKTLSKKHPLKDAAIFAREEAERLIWNKLGYKVMEEVGHQWAKKHGRPFDDWTNKEAIEQLAILVKMYGK